MTAVLLCLLCAFLASIPALALLIIIRGLKRADLRYAVKP